MRTFTGKTPEAEATRMRAERLGRSVRTFTTSKDLIERSGRLQGEYRLGRDERGTSVETERISNLNIAVKKWFVSMSFRREDNRLLQKDYHDAEDLFRSGPLPRKPIWTSTHIITAVRMLRHIREGYERELNLLDQVLRPIEDAEAALRYGPDRTKLMANLDMAIGYLTICRQAFDHCEVLVKKVIVPSNIDSAVACLQAIRSIPDADKDDALLDACKTLTKLRSRIEWRIRQVSGMRWKGGKPIRAGGLKHFSSRRENALRPIRDEWILAQLMRYAEDPSKLLKHGRDDLRRIAVLDATRSVLRSGSGDRLTTALRYLEANWRIFEVQKRSKEGVEDLIDKMRTGTLVDDGKKRDYLYGNYRKLYRHILNEKKLLDQAKERKAIGDKEGARSAKAEASKQHASAIMQIDLITLFVNANKPGFVLSEIEETIEGHKDGYLSPLIPSMRSALVALSGEKPDIEEARKRFLEGASALRSAIGR